MQTDRHRKSERHYFAAFSSECTCKLAFCYGNLYFKLSYVSCDKYPNSCRQLSKWKWSHRWISIHKNVDNLSKQNTLNDCKVTKFSLVFVIHLYTCLPTVVNRLCSKQLETGTIFRITNYVFWHTWHNLKCYPWHSSLPVWVFWSHLMPWVRPNTGCVPSAS
jgi:hypothetical protein